MVYSPDGTKVASTHGNHNVYVTDLKTGKNLNTLSGHPRTPWCIAFHPTSNQILATGCLGGQVRVWDLHGGSEVWVTEGHTVIASLAFHPTDRMLVIATYNELHFWDWSEATPFTKCYTANEKEKVRYVSFDSLGHKLITGISNAPPNHTQWDRLVAPTPHHTHLPYRNTHRFFGPERDSDRRSISGCYRSLVDQYEMLVQRYSELSRSLPAATMDRGTDPMDVDAESQFSDFHHRTQSRHSRSRRPPRTRLTRPSTSRERGSNGSLPLIMLQYLRRAHQRLEETRDSEAPNYSGTLPAPSFTHSRIRNHSRQSYPPIRSINLDLPNYYNYSEPSHPRSTHNESYQNTNLRHFQDLQRLVNTDIPNPPPSYDIPIHRCLPNRPSLMTLCNPSLPSRGSNSESNQNSVNPESTLCTCNLESSRSASNPHSTTCDATSNPTPSNLPSTTCDTNSRWWSNRINRYNLAEQRARFHASMEELQHFSAETSTSQNSSEPLLVHSNHPAPRNPYNIRRETQGIYLGTSNSDRLNPPNLRTRTREERELFGRNLESLLETTGYRETQLGHDSLPTRNTNNMSTRDIHNVQNTTVLPNRSTNVRLGRPNNTSLLAENNPSSRLRPGTSLTQDSNFESESPIMLPPNQTMTITTKPRGSRCVQLSNQTLQPTTSREDNTQIGLSASLNNVLTTSEQTSSQNHITDNTSCNANEGAKPAHDDIINVRNTHSKLLSSLKVSVELRKRLNEILSPFSSENVERSSNSSSVVNQALSNESVLLGQATSSGTQNINSLTTDPNEMSQGGTNSGDSNNDSKSNEYRRLAAFKRKLHDIILSPSNNETPTSPIVDTSTLALVNNEVGSVGNESITNATLGNTVEDGTDTVHRSTDNLTERDALDLSTTATVIPSVTTTPDESALNIIANTYDVLLCENPRTQSNTNTTQTSSTTNSICIQSSTLTPSCSTASSPGSFSVSQRSAFQPPSFQSRVPDSLRVNVGTETPPRPSTRPGEEDGVRYGIQLLSRHIDNMQRLCRARLEILQLQQIRRMWEDLQRQIQSLDVAVNVDQQGNNAHIPSVSQMLELARISDTEENPLPGPSQQQQSTPDNSQLVNCKNKFLLELIKKMIPEAVIPGMSSGGNDSTAVPVSASGHSVLGSEQELSCKGDGVFPSTSSDVSESKKMKIDRTSQGEDLSVSVCNIVNSEIESPCPDPGTTTGASECKKMKIDRTSQGEDLSLSVCNIVNSEIESPCPDPGNTTDASECKNIKTDQISKGEYVQPTGSNSEDVSVARESKFKDILESKLKECLERHTRTPLDLTMEYQASNNTNSNPGRSVEIAESSNESCPVHAENSRQSVFPRSPQSTALLHQLQQRVNARRQRVFNRRIRRRVLRYGEIGCHGSRTTSVVYRHQESGRPLNQHSHRPSSVRVIMSRSVRFYNPSQHSMSASSSGGSRRNSVPEFRGLKRKLPRSTAKEAKSSSTSQSSTRTSQPAEDASRRQEPSDPTEVWRRTIRAMIVRLEELVRQQREQRASLMRELMRSNRGSSRQRSSEMWELRERTPWLRGEVNSESDSDSNPDIESQLSTIMNWNDDAMRRLGNTLGLGRGSSSPGTAAGSSRASDETQGNTTSAGLDETRRSWDQTRESTQRQAREVLSLMVGSLTEFFRNHNVADQSTHTVLEEQICNLYVLLHLALELTDLLLAQLVYTRRELEQQWVHNRLRTPPASLDRSTSNSSSSFSRSNNRRVPHCPPPPRTIPIIYQQLVLLRQQRQGGERRRPRVSRGPSPLPTAIPVLQVNDLPVPDTPTPNPPTFPRLSRPLSPSPHPFGFASHSDLSWDPHGFHGFHVWRPRNLHHFMSDFVTDTPEDATPGPGLNIRGASAGQETMYLGETALVQSHRIQVWDFSKFNIPKIGNALGYLQGAIRYRTSSQLPGDLEFISFEMQIFK
uniref:Activating molecule in BECN1-regulated autophagy protein 1 n=1 Tax=Timema bartmani TaxID=61472 RepID=A0A7R9EPU7_9NEOP|nr:unnamed protein product [Timema bartmani]